MTSLLTLWSINAHHSVTPLDPGTPPSHLIIALWGHHHKLPPVRDFTYSLKHLRCCQLIIHFS
jgi:hypothetical protein